jgi:hypothetical protein
MSFHVMSSRSQWLDAKDCSEVSARALKGELDLRVYPDDRMRIQSCHVVQLKCTANTVECNHARKVSQSLDCMFPIAGLLCVCVVLQRVVDDVDVQ